MTRHESHRLADAEPAQAPEDTPRTDEGDPITWDE